MRNKEIYKWLKEHPIVLFLTMGIGVMAKVYLAIGGLVALIYVVSGREVNCREILILAVCLFIAVFVDYCMDTFWRGP